MLPNIQKEQITCICTAGHNSEIDPNKQTHKQTRGLFCHNDRLTIHHPIYYTATY